MPSDVVALLIKCAIGFLIAAMVVGLLIGTGYPVPPWSRRQAVPCARD